MRFATTPTRKIEGTASSATAIRSVRAVVPKLPPSTRKGAVLSERGPALAIGESATRAEGPRRWSVSRSRRAAGEALGRGTRRRAFVRDALVADRRARRRGQTRRRVPILCKTVRAARPRPAWACPTTGERLWAIATARQVCGAADSEQAQSRAAWARAGPRDRCDLDHPFVTWPGGAVISSLPAHALLPIVVHERDGSSLGIAEERVLAGSRRFSVRQATRRLLFVLQKQKW